MTGPFRGRRGTITVALSTQERAILRGLPEFLDGLGDGDSDPAAARLNPSAYPDDPAADADFRNLVEDDLARSRASDRKRFLDTLSAESIDEDDAQAWLRVLGDARLALAARMGIQDEQWEDDRSLAESSEGATLHYLSYLQDSLIRALSSAL